MRLVAVVMVAAVVLLRYISYRHNTFSFLVHLLLALLLSTWSCKGMQRLYVQRVLKIAQTTDLEDDLQFLIWVNG